MSGRNIRLSRIHPTSGFLAVDGALETRDQFGIGSDFPDANLHVEGNVYASSNLEIGQANLFVDTTTTRVGVGTRDLDATLHVEGNAYVSSNLEIGQANLFVDTTTTRVGIGTRDLDATLHVEGNAYVSSNLEIGQANLFVDTTTTRVGIGTDNPDFTLDVNGDINFSGQFYQGGSPFVSTPWTIETNPDALTYTSGNVAIGTTSTDHKLTVGGPLRITDGLSNVVDISAQVTAWEEQDKLQASDKKMFDQFGSSISISNDGNTAIVGAASESTGGERVGAIYIFNRSERGVWSETRKLQARDWAEMDEYGWSVAISGDGRTAIVGAHREHYDFSQSGAAYILSLYTDGIWYEELKIGASDRGASYRFGTSVAISDDGNTVIVGAPWARVGSDQAGMAYIFTRSGYGVWPQTHKLKASDSSDLDRFGYSVAITGDGNTVAIGANAKGDSNSVGGAYIFTRSEEGEYVEQGNLQASDKQIYDYFGGSISISNDGNTVIVGAYYKSLDFNADPIVFGAGAAYVFTRSEQGVWSEQQKIQSSDLADRDRFGTSVSLSNDGRTAIVGAQGNNSDAGAAYIFTRSGQGEYVEQQKLQASDTGYLVFGSSGSISGDGETAIFGAPGETSMGTLTGAAYVFQLPPANLVVTGDIIANGTSLSFTGQHLCFPEGPIERGLVVSANRNKFMNLNGPLSTGLNAIKSTESLPIVSLSNVANDPTVFGVVDRVETLARQRRHRYGKSVVVSDKEYGDDRAIINSLGEGAMWVVNTNGNLLSGEYITTSNISGYGHKQDDDILHSYTVAKITMDCDFSPEDLPVQVIKKDENGNNVLDKYGRLQWEDTDRMEKAYRVRYLTSEGEVTDESNAVWTAAYVGCTYHCG
jgi:hypothetical protein